MEKLFNKDINLLKLFQKLRINHCKNTIIVFFECIRHLLSFLIQIIEDVSVQLTYVEKVEKMSS